MVGIYDASQTFLYSWIPPAFTRWAPHPDPVPKAPSELAMWHIGFFFLQKTFFEETTKPHVIFRISFSLITSISDYSNFIHYKSKSQQFIYYFQIIRPKQLGQYNCGHKNCSVSHIEWALAYNSSIWEMEAKGSCVQGHLGLYKTLSQKQTFKPVVQKQAAW